MELPDGLFEYNGQPYRYSTAGGLERMALCSCGRWIAAKTLEYSNARYKHYATRVHIDGLHHKASILSGTTPLSSCSKI